MNEKALVEIFEELYESIESAEAQSNAAIAFLKSKGLAAENKLQPYLDQASAASSVRWMATRARMKRLLESALSELEKDIGVQVSAAKPEAEGNVKSASPDVSGDQQKASNKEDQADRKQPVAGGGNVSAEATAAVARNPAAGPKHANQTKGEPAETSRKESSPKTDPSPKKDDGAPLKKESEKRDDLKKSA
jgi:hypothetical protein